MNDTKVYRLFILTVLLLASFFTVQMADASALDSALNNSLKETRDISTSLDYAQRDDISVKAKPRKEFEISLDEVDSKKAINSRSVAGDSVNDSRN